MARKCFFSFHYQPDNWRVSTIRSIGAIEGNQSALDNDWEKVTKGGDAQIEKWINSQMEGRTCAIILIGTNTAKRKWIDYEIKTAWAKGMGVLGIHIHGIKDSQGNTSLKGSNPFAHFTLGSEKTPLSSILEVFDPTGVDSKAKYNQIADNIDGWIERAIKIRNKY
ncbi:TIR domain-containing protein [Pseudomonas sp. ML96]|uniref:TIR domain-containing protein n=1 Tax=Pseudomonas sp. ML96 TaxID=1523503 RepID=UPI0005BC81DB|nr:TIR domain-containing protein [Pseudomonas sp. ML96]